MAQTHLTETEKNDIIELIKQGRSLPKEYILKPKWFSDLAQFRQYES
jgi:hypothetical protein